jgi:hypothetical protein
MFFIALLLLLVKMKTLQIEYFLLQIVFSVKIMIFHLVLITGIGGLSPLIGVEIVHFVEGSDCLKLVS